MNQTAVNSGSVEMADLMHSDGKIYVVILVLLVIFFGIVGYLIFLDRKIRKIELEVNGPAGVNNEVSTKKSKL